MQVCFKTLASTFVIVVTIHFWKIETDAGLVSNFTLLSTFVRVLTTRFWKIEKVAGSLIEMEV